MTPMPPSPGQPGDHLSSQQFRPPKDNKPLLVTIIVVAVVVAVVATGAIVAWISDKNRSAPPADSPSPAATAPSQSGNGIDFVSDDGAGRLEINNHRWQGGQLFVEISLSVSKGEVLYGTDVFNAFDQAGNLYPSSTDNAPAPQLTRGYLQAGEQTRGWVAFRADRQQMTLIMLSEYNKVITEYLIKD